ncbi:MAG: PKD domain-containing protein [Bacteroidota bacterium]
MNRNAECMYLRKSKWPQLWSGLCFLLFFTFLPKNLLQAQTIEGPQMVCAGDEVTYVFTGTIDPNLSYEWTVLGGAPVLSTNQMISLVWQIGGLGAVTLEACDDQGNCTNYSIDVEVSDIGMPDIFSSFQPAGGEVGGVCLELECPLEKPDGIFYACSGQAVTYFVADIPDATYEWFVSTGGNIESGQGTSTISAIWSDPGVYALLLDIELNGCTQTLRYCVRVSESPSVQIQAIPEPAGGIVSICPGQMVLFSNDLENVFWDFGDGQFSESQNPSHTYTDPGTYTISLTGFSTCDCPGTNTLTINVIGAEAPNIESTSVECQDASITSYAVTNTLGCDMAKYTWTIQDTDGDGNADGQFLNPPSFPSLDPEVEVVWDFPSTGIGILCVEVENCGAVCTQEVCVEITAILKDAMIEGPEVVCEGELATYTIPIMPGATYNWSVDGGDLQTPANTHTINVEWGLIAPSTGTVSLDLAINSTLNCSPSLDDLEVSILPTPEINGLNTYCEGESPTYSISGNSNPIVWSLFDEAGSLIDQQNGFTYIMAADLATGNYTLMGNALEFCEEASKLINILPIAPVPEIEPFDPVCRDAIATYTANVGDDLLITWEVTGGEILNNASSSTILVDWDASGNYSLSITQEYASGPACPSDPLVVEVPVIADETLSINGPSAVLGECEVQYTTSANAENLNWTIEPPQLATIVAGQGSSTITVQVHQVLSGGSEFTVSLTADICGVTQTTSQEVSILTLETPIITGPSEICQGANATWNVINPNPFPITSYNWIFGNGQTATGPGPINSGAYNEAGTQIVQLLVNYELPGVACVEAVTASKEVVVRRLPLAYVTSPTGYVICINDPLPLTLFATEQTAPTSTGSLCYEWRDQADALVGTGSVLTGITEPGIYTLTVKFKDGDLTCTSGQQITIEEEFCAETCEDYTIEYIAKCSSYRFNLVVPDGQQGPVIWNFGDGTIEGPVSSDEVVFHTYENAGFYFVSARLGDCEVVRSIIVPLVADFTAEVTCNNAGNGYQIDVVSFSEFVPGFPPVIYEYRYMNTLLLSTTNPIASIPTAGLPTGPVEIAMTVVSSYNGRKCTVRQTVDIPEQLEAFFEVDNPSCEGTLLAFENLSTGSITSTQWDFGDGSGSGQPGDVDKVYLGFTDDPFTPMVSLTVNDQYGCSNTYTETLNINQNSLSGFIAVSKNLPACADEGATLTANFTSDAPPINYAWFRAGEEGVIATGPSITVFEAGVYTLQVSDGENCMQELVSPYIALYPAIVPSIEGLGNPCFGDGIFLSTNYSNDGTAIDWSITNPNGTTFTNNNFTITMMGTYMVHVTVEDETTGCTGTASLSFEPNPLPELSIAVDPDPACIPLTLSAVSDCEPNCNYLWSTNQTSSSISIARVE